MSAPSFYRYDGSVITPTGNAVPGASIAVLTQPASFSGQPGSPLAATYAGPASNSATITAAVWSGGQISLTFSGSVPADVIPGSFIGLSSVTPSTFNTTLSAPYLVISVTGLVVVVASLTSPGTYVSGGTVATSVLPNPTASDGDGNFFFYAAAGIYSVQIYSPTITERDYPDQDVGVVASGAGSVTSAALTMPAIFTVSGSPITSTGTFAVTLATETANTVWAGPASGSAAGPTFRALVAADIPGGASGVTSVALTLAVPSFLTESVSGSPITTTGTLAATLGLATQTANRFFAGPASGGASTPTFRPLAVDDFNGGTSAGTGTYWRGDLTWQAIPTVGVKWSANEVPSGATTAFTVANTPDGVIFNLYRNGLLQKPGSGYDYTRTGTAITLTTTIGSDTLLANYTYAGPGGVVLETGGSSNSTQSLLNLAVTGPLTIAESAGTVTITNSLLSMLAPASITPPVIASLTWGNQGSATAVANAGGGIYFSDVAGGNSDDISFLYKAAPSPPYTLTIGVAVGIATAATSWAGIILRESATGKIISFHVGSSGSGSATAQVGIDKYTNYTTYSAAYLGPLNTYAGPVTWLQVTVDAVHITWYSAIDGQNFKQLLQKTLADYFTSGPNEVGIGIDNYTSTSITDAVFVHWAGI